MNTDELKALKVDKEVDARGMACPGPLLEAKRAVAEVSGGQVMQVMSSDEGTLSDMQRWSQKIGHEYLGHIEEDGFWSIFVRIKS
ncbi:MAG: sulfurtransferase TusA family protein [candidate division FCPU426 bacterium]